MLSDNIPETSLGYKKRCMEDPLKCKEGQSRKGVEEKLFSSYSN